MYVAQKKAHTNSELMKTNTGVEVVSTNVQYFGTTTGYFVKPKADGQYPGVVMIHENRGLRQEIKDAAESLATEGYMVLAVDLYNVVVMNTQEEARAFKGFEQEKGLENLKAAVNYLKNEGATKMASLGWCFGGRQSVELAVSGEKFDATVVYYGGGMATSTERLAKISWPVLGVFGDQDQVIPVSMVTDFKTSLDTLNIKNEIYVYPGVGHAFANPSGQNYAPNETKDAWEKTLMFLKENLRQ